MSVDALCLGHAVRRPGHGGWTLTRRKTPKSQTDRLLESGGGPAANAAWLLARWRGVHGAGLPGRRRRLRRSPDGTAAGRRGLPADGDSSRPRHARVVHPRQPRQRLAHDHQPQRRVRAPEPCAPKARGACAAPPAVRRTRTRSVAPSRSQTFPSAITVLDAGSLRDGTQVLSRRVHYLVCSERFAAQVTGDADVREDWPACLRRLRELNGTRGGGDAGRARAGL